MMLGYEMVFPPADQLELRRRQLNAAGFEAWLTPIILLATTYAARNLLTSNVSSTRKQSATFTDQLRSIANTTYIPEFGPLHVQLLGLSYISWILFLIFRNTGNDYLHLTKAFGHVAVSQLPLHYLLAWKTQRSPVVLATGITPIQLNAYHRLFGRMIHALLATHAILYVNFFVVKGLLAKRIQDRDVRLGILAFWSFNILGLLALPVVRKGYRRVFYRSHVSLSGLIVVILFFHVPYTRRYVVQSGVFWLANWFLGRQTVKSGI